MDDERREVPESAAGASAAHRAEPVNVRLEGPGVFRKTTLCYRKHEQTLVAPVGRQYGSRIEEHTKRR